MAINGKESPEGASGKAPAAIDSDAHQQQLVELLASLNEQDATLLLERARALRNTDTKADDATNAADAIGRGPDNLISICGCCNAEAPTGGRRRHTVPKGPKAVEAAVSLMQALETGNWPGVHSACDSADLTYIGEAGWTCMHWAVHVAKTAQSAGDDCGQIGSCDCCQPAPANPASRPFLRKLVTKLANEEAVNTRSSDDATALMFAADAGDVEACNWLLEAGADFAARDSDGDTAASWARQRGHLELAFRLETGDLSNGLVCLACR